MPGLSATALAAFACAYACEAADKVKGLKYTPGITKWKVAVKDNVMYTGFEEVPESLHSQVRPYMFAPPEGVDPKFRY